MTYAVKEIFYTLQGEGANAGRPAVFCRFAGCNLWTGHEKDRATAVCTFCDTDFVGTDGDGGGKFHTAQELADAIAEQWPSSDVRGTPLRRVHRRRAAAADGPGARLRAARGGLRDRRRDERHAACRPTGSTGSA